ncbi:uncharacterized protein LOC119611370 isoform X2 [Lucilia sericata]|uniref:uncharacterized protein LOC119611370 isoform X2 n=1 Tax=Lucilia sericata TaxID=13632 RepID=UPI0018A85991|nr:uncharacterized protein LOC119611370 isoform X2 [Lucilia sericata]
MLAGIRKRLARKQLDIKECEDDDKDDLHANAFVPPTNYIKISQGKIQLVHQPPTPVSTPSTLLPPPPSSPPPPFSSQHICNGLESPNDKSQCGSPTFEKELRQQLEK